MGETLGLDSLAVDTSKIDPEVKRKIELDIVRSVHLKRDALSKMLLDLPDEVGHKAVIGSLVLITTQEGCLLATVDSVEESAEYLVTRSAEAVPPDGDTVRIRLQIRCARGTSKRVFKVSHVSNQELTEAEFDQWRSFTSHARLDPELVIAGFKTHAATIVAARNFCYNEDGINKIIRKKPTLEFLPQQESRLKSMIACSLSQMDISGIRDHEARELEGRYHKTLEGIHTLEAKVHRSQEDWFEKRPGQYSVKEINRKNFFRQQNKDRHALDYVFRVEEGAAGGGSNPFNRRTCRPLCAWDVTLTGADAPAPKEAAPAAGAAKKDDKAAGDAPAESSSKSAPQKLSTKARMESMLKAHRSHNLLSKLSLPALVT